MRSRRWRFRLVFWHLGKWDFFHPAALEDGILIERIIEDHQNHQTIRNIIEEFF
jgi:hypothetical protein